MWSIRLTDCQREALRLLIEAQGEVGPSLTGALESLELARWDDLPDAVAEAGSSTAAARPSAVRFHDTIKQTKKDLIVRAVEEANGNYNAAARLLGLHPNYLHRLIKNLQLKATLNNPS